MQIACTLLNVLIKLDNLMKLNPNIINRKKYNQILKMALKVKFLQKKFTPGK